MPLRILFHILSRALKKYNKINLKQEIKYIYKKLENRNKMTNYIHDYIFKVVVIGNGAVGKTSLIKRFTKGEFNKEYIKTLGAQFSRYEVVLNDFGGTEGKIRAKLFFWDIAGQKDFSFMRPTFYNGAKAVIVIFDTTRDESLDAVPEWVDDIGGYCEDLPSVLFANKIDLLENPDSYETDKVKGIMADKGISKIFPTSAKSGENVHDAFNYIIENLVTKSLKEENK